jgi:hypothetical protein
MRLRVLQDCRTWTWVRALALLAVLMHAGLLVRHSVSAAHAAGVSALPGAFCTADAATEFGQRFPEQPAPSQNTTPCPVCTGCVGAAALLPTPSAINHWFKSLPVPVTRDHGSLRSFATGLPPPNRGPPLVRG